MDDALDPASTGPDPGQDAGTAITWDTDGSDTILNRYLADWAAFNGHVALAAGGAVDHDDDLVLADLTSANFFLNTVTVRHPRAALDLEGTLRRARAFFDRRPGGAFLVVSPWPTPSVDDLTLVGHPPLMLRPAGGAAPSLPDGLEIRVVRTEADLRAFEAIEAEAFAEPLPGYPTAVLDVPGWTMWLGFLDGEPVATSAAALGHGITRVEWIATLPSARGRGVGEAMTWQATLADPSRDAVLIASDMGRPVYERMGYRALTRATLWRAERSSAS